MDQDKSLYLSREMKGLADFSIHDLQKNDNP